MAKFKEILDALNTDMILNIFQKKLSEENDEESRGFVNRGQKMITKETRQNLVKELKTWRNIRESKESIVSGLAAIALADKRDGRIGPRLKNAIVENLRVKRDAQYRINQIKRPLGDR